MWEHGGPIRYPQPSETKRGCGWRSAKPFISRFISPIVGTGGVLRPKHRILGGEFAGEVEAVGAAVNQFQVSDRVFGTSLFGAHAEYVAVRAGGPVAPMPAGMSFEEAAAVSDGAILALGCLRKAEPLKGKEVLVYGASGSIGTAGVQLARYFDAHVTAVCNTKNLELVRSLGADEVIDYLHEDFAQNGKTYDVIFDAVGRLSFRRCRASLKPGGAYLPTDGFENAFWLLWTRRVGDKKVLAQIPPRYTKKDVLFLKELIESGHYRAVIDRSYPLEDVVEAKRYVETQQKTGTVVLIVNGGRPR